jgi:hydroxymethylpyrimidine pyrophosphatase-like HAD family hydrolase
MRSTYQPIPQDEFTDGSVKTRRLQVFVGFFFILCVVGTAFLGRVWIRMQKPYKHILFSDLDGTIVHFQREVAQFTKIQPLPSSGSVNNTQQVQPDVTYTDLPSNEQRLCYTLPSSTAGPAYISAETHRLVQELRKRGVLFVIVTAGRKSTLLSRVPMLPFADVYVGETGGRVLLNTKSQLLFPTGAPVEAFEAPEEQSLALDADWGSKFVDVTGSLENASPPEERVGALWDVYRELQEAGFNPDGRSYWGCFRVDLEKSVHPGPKAQELMQEIIAKLPSSITTASNLGKIDFYPAVSGKGGVAEYLLEKFGLRKADSFAIFDDDNDLPMAAAVGQGYVVRAHTKSVEDAIKGNPHWKVATPKGVLASEEMLKALLQSLQSDAEVTKA